MANPRELRNARRKHEEARDSYRAIKRLPRRIGQQVVWSNGVVWTRTGDDQWQPDSEPSWRYPSAHVASLPWQPHTPPKETP